MNKFIFSFFIALQIGNCLVAQTSNLGEPTIFKDKITKTTSYYTTPNISNEEEIIAEKARQTANGDKMYRFGKEHSVDLDVFASAESSVLPNGDVLYQYGIECKNAVSINLVFDHFELANGVRMYFADPVKKKFDGAYTHLNNNPSKMLGTELIYAEKTIIEIVVPQDKVGQSTLHLGTIIHGYRSLDDMAKALNSSGDCEIDVNCPLGQGWENQRNSVAMMVNGGGFCTGSLVNNTSGVIIPYFLSANHCGTNPGGWVFRFRWESPEGQADCGTAVLSVDGPTTMNINGGTLCANNATSDFALTLLNASPDPAWGIYYNGWDHTNIPATELTCIHHPSGDVKKISRDNSTAVSSSYGGVTPDTHWQAPSWDEGVTEGGSSGSPLFNEDQRIIGQLQGGPSSCSAPPENLNDHYGKFYLSWTGGGTNSTRLSNWLDPNGLGSEFIDGVDPAVPLLTVDAGISHSFVNLETLCGGSLTPQVEIYNAGTDPLTAVTIHYGFNGATNLTYNWTGSLPSYGTETVLLPSTTLADGSHLFTAIVENSVTDQNLENDTTIYNFTTATNGEIFTLTLHINCYASETTWQVTDTLLQTIFTTSGSYTDNTPTPIIDSFCLAEGCYTFTLLDSYGDGISGSGSTCDPGSYVLTNSVNDTIGELLPIDADFGTSISSVFCIGEAGISKIVLDYLIEIYPNPASSSFTISKADGAMNQIEILSIAGQQIMHLENHSTSVVIDSESFAKGMYLVRISTDVGMIVKQLVIR